MGLKNTHKLHWVEGCGWQNFRPRCGSGVDSTSNRNEYQGYVLGVKGGRSL